MEQLKAKTVQQYIAEVTEAIQVLQTFTTSEEVRGYIQVNHLENGMCFKLLSIHRGTGWLDSMLDYSFIDVELNKITTRRNFLGYLCKTPRSLDYSKRLAIKSLQTRLRYAEKLLISLNNRDRKLK